MPPASGEPPSAIELRRARVLIFQPALPHYRVPLFRALAERVGTLRLVHGTPDKRAAFHESAQSGLESVPVAHGRVGPLLWMPSLLTELRRGEFELAVFSWNLRYAHLPFALNRCRKWGIASVVWGHGYSPDDSWVERRLRFALARMADVAITYAERARQDAIRHGLSAQRVFAAPNAIDLSRITALRKELAAQPWRLAAFRAEQGLADRPIALFVSRLASAEDFRELFAAWTTVQREVPQALLAIIGAGVARPGIERECQSLGLDSVRFLGAIYDEPLLAPWFMSACCLAMPRRVGLSLNHAFAYGLPIVSFDTPARHGPEFESAVHGETALLAPDNDVHALTAHLTAVLTNRELQAALRAGALGRAEHLTLDRMVDGYCRALSAALQARG